jgi:hypothetical protein
MVSGTNRGATESLLELRIVPQRTQKIFIKNIAKNISKISTIILIFYSVDFSVVGAPSKFLTEYLCPQASKKDFSSLADRDEIS